jgi:hypothetical protein
MRRFAGWSPAAVRGGQGEGPYCKGDGDHNDDGFPDLGVFSRSIGGSGTNGGMLVVFGGGM